MSFFRRNVGNTAPEPIILINTQRFNIPQQAFQQFFPILLQRLWDTRDQTVITQGRDVQNTLSMAVQDVELNLRNIVARNNNIELDAVTDQQIIDEFNVVNNARHNDNL
jgi:hypothetical protein